MMRAKCTRDASSCSSSTDAGSLIPPRIESASGSSAFLYLRCTNGTRSPTIGTRISSTSPPRIRPRISRWYTRPGVIVAMGPTAIRPSCSAFVAMICGEPQAQPTRDQGERVVVFDVRPKRVQQQRARSTRTAADRLVPQTGCRPPDDVGQPRKHAPCPQTPGGNKPPTRCANGVVHPSSTIGNRRTECQANATGKPVVKKPAYERVLDGGARGNEDDSRIDRHTSRRIADDGVQRADMLRPDQPRGVPPVQIAEGDLLSRFAHHTRPSSTSGASSERLSASAPTLEMNRASRPRRPSTTGCDEVGARNTA